jgi:hypothetical protein
MPAAVDPATLAFATPATGEQFRRADRAARRLAGPGWAVRAGPTYPSANWPGGYKQVYTTTWTLAAAPGRPNHTIVLSTELYQEPRQANGFNLRATWAPTRGWDALVDYRSYDGEIGFVESFSVTLSHPDHLPGGQRESGRGPLLLGPEQVGFRATRTDDQYAYDAVVTSRPRGADWPLYRPQGEVLGRYWSSAAAFREAALAELDRLAENARREIPSGHAFSVRALRPLGGYTTLPRADGAKVPPAVRAEVLDQALAEVEDRRALVRAHAEGMHAAAVAAFPDLPEVGRPTPKGQ